ncbi:MAG: phycobiliprotein lyase [Phormidesmis sp.]
MEIVNFFEKMAGRWFSQRTTHALSSQQSKAGKSDLEVTFLAPDTDEVQALYIQTYGQVNGQENKDKPSARLSPLCGLQIQQSSTIEGDSKPTALTTLLVPLTAANDIDTVEPNSPTNGTFLRSGQAGTGPIKGSYSLEDEVLTFVTDGPEASSTERLWFINDNLRMRTGLTELSSGLRIASFCSEIRLGVKPPKAEQ